MPFGMLKPPPRLPVGLGPSSFHPLAEPSFWVFAGRLFAIGDFSTNRVSQLQGFFINTGYYREGRKNGEKLV